MTTYYCMHCKTHRELIASHRRVIDARSKPGERQPSVTY